MIYFDTHTHALSDDTDRYPTRPLGGTRSVWSQVRPVDGDGLVRALDHAGVDRAVLVHASTVYGFDNSYAADTIARYPDRFVGVCAIDFLAESALDDINYWIGERGFRGVRIRAADGNTAVPVPGEGLSDLRMARVWRHLQDQRIPVCIQMHSKNTPQLVAVLDRHPELTVLLDHAGRPDVSGGAPYPRLAEISALAPYDRVHFKITPPMLRRIEQEPEANVDDVLRRLIDIFGIRRFVWGSNFPASEGSALELRQLIESYLGWLDESDRADVLGLNAARIYDERQSTDATGNR